MGLGWACFWLVCTLGRLLAWSPLGPMGWQCLEEATALPRVGLLDGPECRSKAEQPRCHTAPGKHYLSTNHGRLLPYFWQDEESDHPEPTLAVHGGSPKKHYLLACTSMSVRACAFSVHPHSNLSCIGDCPHGRADKSWSSFIT